jgi:hypothetical protein
VVVGSEASVRMKKSRFCVLVIAVSLAVSATMAQASAQQSEPAPTTGQQPAAPQAPEAAQTPAAPAYTPKFRGDPARSDSEATALAYMRVVMRAQVGFNKHYGHYATSLTQLVHSGTFTQRMVNPDRGDYTAGFRGKTDGFVLTMTPKNLDAQHRSFYATEDGKIHADETKPADADSQVVETHHW